MMQRQTTTEEKLPPLEQGIFNEIKALVLAYDKMAKIVNGKKSRHTRHCLLMDMYEILEKLLQYDAHYDTNQKATFEGHLKMVREGLDCDDVCKLFETGFFDEQNHVAFTMLTEREAHKEGRDVDVVYLHSQSEKVPRLEDMTTIFASVNEQDGKLRECKLDFLQPLPMRQLLPFFTWILRLPGKPPRTIYTVLARAKLADRPPDLFLLMFCPAYARPGFAAFHFFDKEKAKAARQFAGSPDEVCEAMKRFAAAHTDRERAKKELANLVAEPDCFGQD
jgi:hypothetical protein